MDNKTTIHGLLGTTIGVIALIVVYIVIPMIGSQVDTAIVIPGGGYATNTFNFTGNTSTGQYINISTGLGTYDQSCFQVNTTGIVKDIGCWVISVDGTPYLNTSTGSATAFRAALANDTDIASLITVTNTSETNVIITLNTMNDDYNWAVSETATNGAWASTSFTGGVDGSNWNSTVNPDVPTAVSLWASLAGLIKISAFMIIIGSLILTVRGIRSKN